MLTCSDWQHILLSQDPQEAYTLFYRKLITDYNTCFPLKTFKSTYTNRKPWLSDDLREMIKKKNILMLKAKKTSI